MPITPKETDGFEKSFFPGFDRLERQKIFNIVAFGILTSCLCVGLPTLMILLNNK